MVIILTLSFTFPIVAIVGAKPKYWILDPLVIDDWGFGDYTWQQAALQPWCKGSGTEEDPYIIRNVIIDGEGFSYCMVIMNSEAYFKIMGCTFFNTKPPPVERNAGLALINTQNGVIFKNQFSWVGLPGSGQGSGIALIASHNNKIKKNLCYDNEGPGIYLEASNDNIMTQNLCSGNLYGIIIGEGSSNNEVTKNDCSNNVLVGIFLYNDSNFNSISKNKCNKNGHGIQLIYAHGNDVIDNVCSENFFEQGILVMTYSSYNMITKNRCFKNARSGIVLFNMAFYNTINDNLCYDNFESGIVLDSSYQNTVENNLAYGNGFTGMQVYNAEYNNIAWNTFSENFIGLHIISDYAHWMNSYGNEITNNVCNENLASGISVESSDGNSIVNNNCSENGEAGINLENSYSNLIIQNLCPGNLWGISMGYGSSHNEVIENACSNNIEFGIFLLGNADYNTITDNNCMENLGSDQYPGSGIVLSGTNGNIITDNYCAGHGGAGIVIIGWFGPAEDNILVGNTLEQNSYGVYFSYVNNNDIFRNTINNNIVGIFLEGYCLQNHIYHNNIIENDIQASDEYPGLNNWHNIYMLEGNYWSDYSGDDTSWPGPGYDNYPFLAENGWDITTPEEDEIINGFFDPATNRLRGLATVIDDEICYIIAVWKESFSERTQRIAFPPYTMNYQFDSIRYSYDGSFWVWDELMLGLPGYAQFFYKIVEPNYFTVDLDLDLGINYFAWIVGYHDDYGFHELVLNRSFYLV